jgi:hypothetical protein
MNDEEEDEDDANVICCAVVSLRVTEEGRVHCVALWYHIYLTEASAGGAVHAAKVIDTGPGEGSGHWRQVCFLLDSPKGVRRGELVKVKVVVDKASGVWCCTVND